MLADDIAGLPFLSLKSRLGLLRRRRRVSFLRQLMAAMGPVLVGMALLMLAAFGGTATLR